MSTKNLSERIEQEKANFERLKKANEELLKKNKEKIKLDEIHQNRVLTEKLSHFLICLVITCICFFIWYVRADGVIGPLITIISGFFALHTFFRLFK